MSAHSLAEETGERVQRGDLPDALRRVRNQRADPGEQTPQSGDREREMTARLLDWMQARGDVASRVEVDGETLEHLRALGYLGADSGSASIAEPP